jgi:methyl-accepting chemotaxis protein
MRASILERIAGILSVAGAIIGVIISIVGLVSVWRFKPVVEQELIGGVEIISQMLITTKEGLASVDEALRSVDETMALLESSAKTASDSLEDTSPLIRSIGDLFGKDFTGVVKDTQKSLASAETGAKLIDDTLGLIGGIPFIGARYAPDTPLNTSIREISKSLNGLPESFTDMQEGLEQAADNLELIQEDIADLGGKITGVKGNLSEAHDVIGQYKTALVDLNDRIAVFKKRLPGIINGAAFCLSVILLWVLLTQTGFLLQNLKLFRKEALIRPENKP